MFTQATENIQPLLIFWNSVETRDNEKFPLPDKTNNAKSTQVLSLKSRLGQKYSLSVVLMNIFVKSNSVVEIKQT